MTRTKRAKVARAIEPNQGEAAAAGRKIRRIVNAFENEFKREAIALIKRYVPATKAQDGAQDPIKRELIKLQARLMIKLGKLPRRVSQWYCKKMLKQITTTQRRTLERAGISTAWLKQKWTVPIIRGQYISPEAAKKIPNFVDWSTSLITKMCEKSAQKVQDAIADGLSKGYSFNELQAKILSLENMDEARASRVALDQSCKLNQFVQLENAKAIGVTKGIWVHVPGQYSSRETHIDMHGHEFDLDKGMYDPDVDAHVKPGELPFCRCCFRPVLPEDITG